MNRIVKFGVFAAFVSLFGCTDASQGLKVVTNTVTVTVTVTGDGGGKPGDGHHGDNVGGHEAAGGEGGASATTSSTEGAGGSPATTTTDTGKGGAGGTPVTTTTTKTGTGGGGGAATTTTSSTSTTSTTTTTSTSSTTTSTTTTTSTSTATGPKKATLHIYDVPPTSGNHAIKFFAKTLPNDPAIQWGNAPNISVFGAGMSVNVETTENTKVTYGVASDPPVGTDPSQGAYWVNQGCDPATFSLTHAAWAEVTIEGVTYPAAPITVESNGQGGCHMVAIAAKSPKISATDEDGDGYLPNDPNPKLRDCDDKSNAVHPGAIETPGTYDKVDTNCDGWLDPPKAVISMLVAVPAASLMPTFRDVANGKDYPLMALGPKSQVYQVTIEATKQSLANLEAYVFWPQTNAQYNFCVNGICYDSSFSGGSCHDGVSLEIFWDTDLTETPLELVPVGNPAFTCHRRIKK